MPRQQISATLARLGNTPKLRDRHFARNARRENFSGQLLGTPHVTAVRQVIIRTDSAKHRARNAREATTQTATRLPARAALRVSFRALVRHPRAIFVLRACIKRWRVQLIVNYATDVEKVHLTLDAAVRHSAIAHHVERDNFRTKMLPCQSLVARAVTLVATERTLREPSATCAPQASIGNCRTQSTALHAPQGGSVTRLSRSQAQTTARRVHMVSTTMCRARLLASLAKPAQRVTSGVFAMRVIPETASLVQ